MAGSEGGTEREQDGKRWGGEEGGLGWGAASEGNSSAGSVDVDGSYKRRLWD